MLATFSPEMLTAQDPTPEPVTKRLVLFDGKNLDAWYTFLHNTRTEDPLRVFTLQGKLLRISGEDWGGITTKRAFRDYHLIVEWKWGTKTWAKREKAAKDSGILVHAVGPDDAYGGHWPQSIESQIIEGGAGDFIVVPGKGRPELTAECDTKGSECYFRPGAPKVTKTSGRINWWGRSPEWKDQIGFRGAKDVEKPSGEWNRQEVICQGNLIRTLVNGVLVNEGVSPTHSGGKIVIQSEGAEMLVRRVELRPAPKQLPAAATLVPKQ